MYESRVTFKLAGGAHVDIRTVHPKDAPDSKILAQASQEFSDRYGFEPLKYSDNGYAIDGLRLV